MYKKATLLFVTFFVQLSYGMEQEPKKSASFSVNKGTLSALASNKTSLVCNALIKEKRALDTLYASVRDAENKKFDGAIEALKWLSITSDEFKVQEAQFSANLEKAKACHIDRLTELVQTNIPFYLAQSRLIRNTPADESSIAEGVIASVVSVASMIAATETLSPYGQISLAVIALGAGGYAGYTCMRGCIPQSEDDVLKEWQEENRRVQSALQKFSTELKEEIKNLNNVPR